MSYFFLINEDESEKIHLKTSQTSYFSTIWKVCHLHEITTTSRILLYSKCSFQNPEKLNGSLKYLQ